jgi:hypothetical protein
MVQRRFEHGSASSATRKERVSIGTEGSGESAKTRGKEEKAVFIFIIIIILASRPNKRVERH